MDEAVPTHVLQQLSMHHQSIPELSLYIIVFHQRAKPDSLAHLQHKGKGLKPEKHVYHISVPHGI